MKTNNLSKKILALLVSVVLIFTTVCSVALTTTAAEGDPEVLALSIKSGASIDYSWIDWDSFGTNLIPDPTVNNFESGVYGTYATPNNNYDPTNVNTANWWDKWVDQWHGFNKYHEYLKADSANTLANYGNRLLTSPKTRGILSSNESLTDDGSGSIKITSSGNYRLPLPNLSANKYYIIKCDVKSTGNKAWSLAKIGLNATSTYEAVSINLGTLDTLNKVKTLVFAVSVGANAINQPMLQLDKADATALYVDNVGVYEVDETKYNTYKTNGEITADFSVKMLNYYGVAGSENTTASYSAALNAHTVTEKWEAAYPVNLFENGKFDSANAAVDTEKATYIEPSEDNGYNGYYEITNGNPKNGNIKLPTLKADKYYLVRIGIKGVGNGLWGGGVEFQRVSGETSLQNHKIYNEVSGHEKIYAFLVSTGSTDLTDARIVIGDYTQVIHIDNIGVHEITSDEFNTYNSATYTKTNPFKLPVPEFSVKMLNYYGVAGSEGSTATFSAALNAHTSKEKWDIAFPSNLFENGTFDTANPAVDTAKATFVAGDNGYYEIAKGNPKNGNIKLPTMTANKHYLVRIGIKGVGNGLWGGGVEFQRVSGETSLQNHKIYNEVSGNEKIYVFLVSAGSTDLTDARIVVGDYDRVIHIDNVGVHEITTSQYAEYASATYTKTNPFKLSIPEFEIKMLNYYGVAGSEGSTAVYNKNLTALTEAVRWDAAYPENLFVNGKFDSENSSVSGSKASYVAGNYGNGNNGYYAIAKGSPKGGDVKLPTMTAKKYYLVRIGIKGVGNGLWSGGVEFQRVSGETSLQNHKLYNEVSNNEKIYVFLVSTGLTDLTDAHLLVGAYEQDAIIDNVGVHEINANEYKKLKDAVYTKDYPFALPEVLDTRPKNPSLTQTTHYPSGNTSVPYEYTGVDFNAMGTNLMKDPTVSNFVDDGNGGKVYATYAAPVSDGGTGYKHTSVDENAWWDKYIDFTHGFNYYYQKVLNGTSPSYDATLTSPKQLGFTVSDYSLTEDGSGSLKMKANSKVNISLPTLQPYTYYCLKFNVEYPSQDWNTFTLNSALNTKFAGASSWTINAGYLGKGRNTVSMVFYTGENEYTNAYLNCNIGKNNTYFDDFGLYALDEDYARACIENKKIMPIANIDKKPSAVKTPDVEGYGYGQAAENKYPDGSFESETALADAKFGQKVLSINEEKSIPMEVEPHSYYLASFYTKTDVADSNSAVVKVVNKDYVLHTESIAASTQWKKTTFIIYTGFKNSIELKVGRGTIASATNLYFDGLCLNKLPTDVADACKAIDTYVEGSCDETVLEASKAFFGTESIWSELISPYTKEKYADSYAKIEEEIEIQKIKERGFAPSGVGERHTYQNIICNDADNLLADGGFENSAYWSVGAVNFDKLTFTSEYSKSGNSLKFSGEKDPEGNSLVYKKRITGLEKNTYYYLSVEGMGLGQPVSDIDFGFMDTIYGLELENPLCSQHDSFYVYVKSFKQRVNFQCQDGTWYRRGYRFNTGENTELDFFIRGSIGTIYFDNIKLFEGTKAVTDKGQQIGDLEVISREEDKFACADKDNLITNGNFNAGTKFWKDFNGFNKFVEVATSSGNKMLHFKGNDLAYYYLPWVDVKANTEYTFSFWTKNLNGESSNISLISESNHHGGFFRRTIDGEYGEWRLISVKFTCKTDNRVALGVFNRDGEAVVDNVRLFESKKAINLSAQKDIPVGGDKFEATILGSDGVYQEIVDDSSDDFQDDEYFEDTAPEQEIQAPEDKEEEESKQTTTIIKRRRKKIITYPGFPIWAIVLIVVGSVAAVGGGIFLFIFLKKRKKNKNE